MPTDVAELLFVNPIKMIQTACSKALRGGNIKTDDQIEADIKFERALRYIVKQIWNCKYNFTFTISKHDSFN